jgi:hypothetical protein
MSLKFTNNASATLAASIISTSTSITVTTGQGTLFPALGSGDYFYATLYDSSNNIEIIKVTARSGDTMTAVRGQDGTTARAYAAADKLELRVVAAAMNDFVTKDGDNTHSGTNTFSGAIVSSGTNTYSGATTVSGSMVITGTLDAPTQTLGNNTTLVSTTAFVQSALQALYPVGSIYINAVNSTSPASLFGFGTWAAFGAGRVPVGYDSTNALFNAGEKTGGSADLVVPYHNHTATFTGTAMAPHAHTMAGIYNGASGPIGGYNLAIQYSSGPTATSSVSAGTPAGTVAVDYVGSSGNATNANYQPYITVFMWKRTA